MKKQVIYLNSNGKINKIDTFINNHTYIMPIFITILFLICGLVEGM